MSNQACYKLLTACSKLVPTAGNKQCEHNFPTAQYQQPVQICCNLFAGLLKLYFYRYIWMIQKLQAILGNWMATEQKLLNFYKIRMKALEVRFVRYNMVIYLFDMEFMHKSWFGLCNLENKNLRIVTGCSSRRETMHKFLFPMIHGPNHDYAYYLYFVLF